jgi:MFS transporter, MHS family, proline/betaine transporter
LLTVPAGVLSDHWGRKPVLLAASAGVFVMSWPLLWMMHHPSFPVIRLGQLGFAALIATFNGAGPAAMVETPSRARCTVVSVGLNLVYGVVGGLTPIIAIYTIKRSGDDLAPAFLLMAMAAVSFAVITKLRETYNLALVTQVTESAADD